MIVMDCCAAFQIALGTQEGCGLESLFAAGEKIAAPPLFRYELAHVLAKYLRGGHLSKDQVVDVGSDAMALIDEFADDADLWMEVVAESHRLGHSSYDLFYMILARRNAATLFTLDRRLQTLCMENGVDCVFLEDVAEEDGRV